MPKYKPASLFAQLLGIARAEVDDPAPYGLVGHHDPAFGKQVLNVAVPV